MDPVRRAPGGLVPVVWTGFPDGRDPVITQSPAEVLVGDCRDIVDMDVTVDSYQAVPDVAEDCAVVAMVGLDAIRMGEDTPMDCEGECAEWDIRNEFETFNGMPVYYGGDLCDSDESDWEYPSNLAYAEYVDRYNFDAPEGMELKVFERLQGADESVTMVGEVTDSGHVHQTSSDMVCTEPVADILTVRHDVRKWLVLRFAGVPVRLMAVGQPCPMKVISVIRTVDRWKIVREILGRTGVILLFEMDTVGFHRILMIHYLRLCSVASCFGMRTLPSRHECCQIMGMCWYRHYRFSLIQ